MAASSNLIGDVGTVIANGPSTTTVANAIAAAGPINDYKGNCNLAKTALQETDRLLTAVKNATDSGDGTLTQINAVIAALNGTGGPSTTLIADLATAIAAGPTALTKAKAIAAAGPITDWLGNLNGARSALQALKALITLLHGVTAASDDNTNKGLLADVNTALA